MLFPHGPGSAALLAFVLLGVQAASVQAVPGGSPGAGSVPPAAPITIDAPSFTQTAGKAPRTLLALSFHNTAKAAANEVRFVVQFQGSENVIVDKGMLSPGTPVAHNYIAGVGVPSPRDASDVAVRYVHFTDGTHWGESPHETGVSMSGAVHRGRFPQVARLRPVIRAVGGISSSPARQEHDRSAALRDRRESEC